MNPMMMMAMAVAMSHRSNSSSTVQTVLGASDSLGQTGRLAIGMVRQRTEEQDRDLADRRVGKELLALLDANQVDPATLEKYPALKRVALLGGAVAAAPAANTAPHAHAGVVAAPASTPNRLAGLQPRSPVDPRYAVAVRAGNVAGIERLAIAADAAAAEATRDAVAAEAAAHKAETDAKAAADIAAAAECEAQKDQANAALAAKAAEAKKKSDEAALVADIARSMALRSRATADVMTHAAKDLKARLAAEC